ncbi:MAG: hypothetical protein HC809_11125 [Gammaproteobacteria bacterium]|nr:hypothetical protein [Gammaproteobacteria bacterium]
MSSERIFQREDGWYFRVRGNTSMGPYINFREASAGLDRYVGSCERQSDLSLSWPRWLHFKSLFRRMSDKSNTPNVRPRQI